MIWYVLTGFCIFWAGFGSGALFSVGKIADLEMEIDLLRSGR